jgi:Flp pilus assembly protein TadD
MSSFGKVILVGFLLAMADASACFGEIIKLRDGSVISGTIRSDDANVIVTADDGTVTTVPRGDIVSVTMEDTVSPADSAKAEWHRTAAEIENSTDLSAILKLHQAFLAKYGNEPAAADAKASLIEYQLLAAQNAVKFRGKWMKPADVDALETKWQDEAHVARMDFSANRFDATFADASVVLKTDPGNPLAQTMLGLAQYTKNNPGASKQTLTKLLESDPTNVVVLNDLASISFDTKAPEAALHYYVQALALKPDNRQLLDNIAYTLNLYPNKRDETFQQLTARFKKADSAMQGVMNHQGLSRWGSGWADQKNFSALQAQMTQLENQMAALDRQYQDDTNKYNALQADIASAQSSYNEAVANDDPNADYYYSQWTDLANQANDLNATIQKEQTDANTLKQQFSRAQQVEFPPARLMNIGDDVNPPPPKLAIAPGT